jgi:hypothetical protein
MRIELEAAGRPVEVVAINQTSTAATAANLVALVSFPLFQDVAEVDAVGLMLAHKDDLFVYDRVGNLSAYLPMGGAINTVLSTPDGYDNVKNAVLGAE